MKRMIILSTLLFVGLLSIRTGKSQEVTSRETIIEHLCQHEWIIESASVEPGIDIGDGNLYTDFLLLMEPCDQDDIFDFRPDFTVVYKTGKLKCDHKSTDEIEKWELLNNNSIIHTTDDQGVVFEMQILHLDDSRFVWSVDLELSDNLNNVKSHTSTFVMVPK